MRERLCLCVNVKKKLTSNSRQTFLLGRKKCWVCLFYSSNMRINKTIKNGSNFFVLKIMVIFFFFSKNNNYLF